LFTLLIPSQVLAHRELAHTKTEQTVLKSCSRDHSNPFVVKLHYSFHDKDSASPSLLHPSVSSVPNPLFSFAALYLALDFHPGGDLATQLARWGRLGRDRARFYAAEIVEGVEGLHRAGIIYR
jgi:serine/threonine protein kinase